MGYTHYWYRVPELPLDQWRKFQMDVLNILIAAPREVSIKGGTGTGPAEVNDEVVFLNGNAAHGESYETFCIERVFSDSYRKADEAGRLYAFCKTGRRPYDVVVTACLIAFKKRFGTLVEVHTDGEDVDWELGRRLCERGTSYGLEYRIDQRVLVSDI